MAKDQTITIKGAIKPLPKIQPKSGDKAAPKTTPKVKK